MHGLTGGYDRRVCMRLREHTTVPHQGAPQRGRPSADDTALDRSPGDRSGFASAA